MSIQQAISNELNLSKEGQILKVIIDREESDYYVGRTEFDSPEVDPEVLISKEKRLQVGHFYQVKIDNAEDYDLFGNVV